MLTFDAAQLVVLLLAWPLAIAGLIAVSQIFKAKTSGLLVYYIAWLSVIHIPGALLLFVNWYQYYPLNWTMTGFMYATVGIVTFSLAAGVTLLILGLKQKPSFVAVQIADRTSARKLAVQLFIFGLVCSAALPFLGAIPSATAIISQSAQLPIIALCILVATRPDSGARLPILLISASLLFPVYTMIFSGFLGFGVAMVLLLSCFCITRLKNKVMYIALAPLLVFVFMSVFVTYMRDRGDLRAAAWYGEGEATTVVSKSVMEFEAFDWNNVRHLTHIDQRLNQNWVVGAAVESLEQGQAQFLEADGLIAAAVAIIPRAIWPDKPTIGGGGKVVTELTGIEFADGTSVGAGQILEFYGAYGFPSLILGMAGLGILLAYADLRSRDAIDNNSYFTFIFWFMPGYAICQPGGNLSEVSSSFISAMLAATLARFLFENGYLKGARRAEIENERALSADPAWTTPR